MKRMALLLAALLTLGVFTACGTSQPKSMTVSPARFSEETDQALQILRDELAFFDYTIDDTVTSWSLDFWVLENGEWTNAGKMTDDAKAGTHRFALRMVEGNCEFYQLDGDGFTKSSYPLTAGLNDCSSTGGSRLEKDTSIEAGGEIVLWAKFGSNESSMSLGELDDFRTTECDAGMAATITFS